MLHQSFSLESKHTELREKNAKLRQEQEAELNPAQRKILLRLIDVQSCLKNDVALESFTKGFKLVSGIAKELETDGLYFYDPEMEEQMQSSGR